MVPERSCFDRTDQRHAANSSGAWRDDRGLLFYRLKLIWRGDERRGRAFDDPRSQRTRVGVCLYDQRRGCGRADFFRTCYVTISNEHRELLDFTERHYFVRATDRTQHRGASHQRIGRAV